MNNDLLPGLSELGLQGSQPPKAGATHCPRLKAVDRTQLSWRLVDVEQLIELDHPARAVWELAGRLDLSRFCASIQAVEGVSGRTPWDPRLLVSLWVYAYSRGIGSAREIERRCLYEPAFQWLCGLESINHHTLSDFRVDHDAALRELFVQVLGVLGAGGLITLERVMHDGTKIRALAAKSSFCRAEQLEQHLVAAHQQVEALGDPRGEQSAGQKAARHRVVQERQQRLERALGEFKQLQESKKPAATLRVSTSEPEARIMKQADGGFAPSYNLQLSTDAAHKMIVGVALTQSGNDWGQLLPAMERIENNCGAKPKQVVADSGFTTRANIVAMATQEIDFVGSLRALGPNNGGGMERRGIQPEYYKQCFEYDPHADIYRCSIGTVLRHVSRKRKGEALEHTYRADVRACQACPFQVACCGSQTGRPRSVTRVQEPAAMVAFCRKMQADEGKQVYRQRSEVAEFPNAWIKEKLGLRKFRLRGLAKVGLEALWACLTYNIQQWIRLTWRQTLASSAG